MPRTVAVFLTLFVTLSALPATLTQERRVVPPGPLTRAANAQNAPDVASSGNGFLAIWLDGRAVQPAGSFLWGSHFAGDGTLTSLVGLKLAEGVFDAHIASDGHDYLIAIRRADGIYTQRFDDEGHALADALKADAATTSPILLASNGSSYLLITNNQSVIQWRMLDLFGSPVGDAQVIGGSSAWNGNAAIVTRDRVYHLIYGTQACVSGQGCTYGVADMAVTNGQAATPRTLVPPSNFLGYVSAASSGDQFIVAWVAAKTINEQVFDANDNAVTPAHELAPAFQVPLTASWDGARYLVSRPGDNANLIGQRVGRDGEVIDPTPFVIANNVGTPPELARSGGRSAIVWSSAPDNLTPPDIYGRVVFDFNELAATSAAPLRLSNASQVHHSPAAAMIAGKTLRVWRSGDGNSSIEMALDGSDAVVLSPENGEWQHDPDVAAIGGAALIVWRSDTHALRRVLGVRIDANGKRLDDQPIVIGQDTFALPPSLDRASVATDGHAFLVAWSGPNVVNARRIGQDGSPLDAAPIVASRGLSFVANAVKVVWTGSMYAVVYAFQDNSLLGRPPAILVELFAARITSSGAALDTAGNRTVYLETGAWLGDLSAAAAGDRVVIAFSERPYGDPLRFELHTVEVPVSSLTPAGSNVVAQCDYPYYYGLSDLDIAARGDTFLVAWSQDGPNGENVAAQFLDRGDPFVIADGGASDVNVIPDANGFTFTYARTDAEAGTVAQLFTRELVLAPERRRAIR